MLWAADAAVSTHAVKTIEVLLQEEEVKAKKEKEEAAKVEEKKENPEEAGLCDARSRTNGAHRA